MKNNSTICTTKNSCGNSQKTIANVQPTPKKNSQFAGASEKQQYQTGEGYNRDLQFFDETNSDNLLKKVRVYYSPIPQNWPKDIIVLTCFFSKKGEKFGQFIDRYIVFTKDALHLFENKDRTGYKGTIDLAFTKIQYFLDENSQNRMGIRFIKNSVVEEYSTKDMSLAKRLKEELTKYSIQTDFYTKFEIVGKIGEGTFAKVHKVKNRETGEFFAAKIFNKDSQDFKDSYQSRDCIIQEIATMRIIPKHENLQHLYEVHETKNNLNLVVDYLPGGELFNFIHKKRNFSFKEAVIVIHQLLNGQSTIAEQNICHRDIKPENILFKYENTSIINNQAVLCDFGLACKANTDGSQLQLTKCGSPGYFAPEIQSQSDQSDRNFVQTTASDVFSMGIIFYILLCGQLPWNPLSKVSILEQNKDARIDFENRILREHDHRARDLLKRMCDRDSITRITAKSVCELLGEYLDTNKDEIGQISLNVDFSQIKEVRATDGLKDVSRYKKHSAKGQIYKKKQLVSSIGDDQLIKKVSVYDQLKKNNEEHIKEITNR